ncbi:MAG: hypothetical protein WB780_02980 [Candidatus Acidiferrales bacterium]
MVVLLPEMASAAADAWQSKFEERRRGHGRPYAWPAKKKPEAGAELPASGGPKSPLNYLKPGRASLPPRMVKEQQFHIAG